MSEEKDGGQWREVGADGVMVSERPRLYKELCDDQAGGRTRTQEVTSLCFIHHLRSPLLPADIKLLHLLTEVLKESYC